MCDSGGGGGGDGGGGGGDGGGGDSGGWSGGGGGDHFNDNHHYHNDHYNGGHGSGDSRSCPLWIASCFLTVFTGIFGAVGVFTLMSSITKERSWLETTGTITDIVTCPRSGNSSSATYAPRIEYTVDGETYDFVPESCSSFKPTVGNDIRVVYDPEHPDEGVNGSFMGLWLLPLFTLGIAIIACSVGAFIIMKKMRTANANNSSNGFATNNNTGSTSQYGSNPVAVEMAAPPDVSKPDQAPVQYSSSTQSPYGYSQSNTQNSTPSQQQNTNTNNSGKPSLFDQMNSDM